MILAVVALVVAFAWVPIAARFASAAVMRRNPVSIAIAVHALFAMWLSIQPIVSFGPRIDGVVVGLSAATCVNFYLTFAFARKRFAEERKPVP